jgi:hypothetical protein
MPQAPAVAGRCAARRLPCCSRGVGPTGGACAAAACRAHTSLRTPATSTNTRPPPLLPTHASRPPPQTFAEKVVEESATDTDFVWIHDYHLLVLPSLLRKRFNRIRCGVFLHSPFPSSEIFRTFPKREEVLRSLLNAGGCVGRLPPAWSPQGGLGAGRLALPGGGVDGRGRPALGALTCAWPVQPAASDAASCPGAGPLPGGCEGGPCWARGLERRLQHPPQRLPLWLLRGLHLPVVHARAARVPPLQLPPHPPPSAPTPPQNLPSRLPPTLTPTPTPTLRPHAAPKPALALASYPTPHPTPPTPPHPATRPPTQTSSASTPLTTRATSCPAARACWASSTRPAVATSPSSTTGATWASRSCPQVGPRRAPCPLLPARARPGRPCLRSALLQLRCWQRQQGLRQSARQQPAAPRHAGPLLCPLPHTGVNPQRLLSGFSWPEFQWRRGELISQFQGKVVLVRGPRPPRLPSPPEHRPAAAALRRSQP